MGLINTTDSGVKEEYTRYTYRKIVFILLCIVLAALFFFISLCVGTLELSINEVFTLFFNHLKGIKPVTPTEIYNDHIVWDFRVPRAIFAIVAGVALGIGGAVMQSVMKNPLADPYTTGVSSGALLGVAVAMILGFSVGGSGDVAVVFNAIIFAMIPIGIIVMMAPFFRKSPATLILSGVAVSFLFNSVTSLLMVSTDAATLAVVYRWMVGNFSDMTWYVVPLSVGMTCIGMAILLPLAGKLNIMTLDDKDAKSLGVNVENLRVLCLVVLGAMTAVIISYVGVIGFVGLVVPHIIRILLGADNKYLMPAAGAFGAVFLLGCDIVSRAIDIGASIPVGVITSAIGAPIFMYLIIRQRRSVW